MSCAAIVSFSTFFAGLAASNQVFAVHKNANLLIIACSIIFSGSFINEILLDIRDYEGDRQHGIYTLATLFGKQIAWISSFLFWYLQFIVNSLFLYHFYHKTASTTFAYLLFPQCLYLLAIENSEFTKESIQQYMQHTNRTLFVLLAFLCGLSI
jgi:4-hydroxybenzoate polyprenyltransferase